MCACVFIVSSIIVIVMCIISIMCIIITDLIIIIVVLIILGFLALPSSKFLGSPRLFRKAGIQSFCDTLPHERTK